jgi:hypothetical protein
MSDKPGEMSDALSKDQLQDWAIGTLQEWFQGYTDASLDTSFMQFKIVVVDNELDKGKGFVFAVREGPQFFPDGELYEVRVKVKKLGKKES